MNGQPVHAEQRNPGARLLRSSQSLLLLVHCRNLLLLRFLHDDTLVGISHSLAFVRLRRAIAAQLRGNLPNRLAVDSLYDDSFLMKLANFGSVDSTNLRSTIEGLKFKTNQGGGVDYDRTIRILVSSLVPSIAPVMDDATLELSQKLHSNPAYIATDECEKEIKTAIAMRIALDKRSVEEMVHALDVLLDKLSAQLIDLIERSESSSSEIREVKRDLEALESHKPTDFKTAHKRLYAIASTLEEKVEVLSKDLKVHNRNNFV